jgi:GT2 family glycosyltransferase
MPPMRSAPPGPTLAEYRARPALPDRQSGGRGPTPARVSIVTIVRNGAATLEATINSVLEQQGASIEYIIVDGGSTDGTLDLVRKYEDRIAIWISERDKGISDAFNKGIALTTGDIVGILNADDVLLPGGVAASVAALNAHPEAGFSFGDCEFYEGDRLAYVRHDDPDYRKLIGRRMPVSHPTVFVRRSVYEQHGLFRCDLKIAMDYDLLLRFDDAGVRGVPASGTITRMHLGGVSSTQVMRSNREALRVLLEHGRPAVPACAEYAFLAAARLVKHGLIRVGAEGLIRRLERARFNG